MIFVGDIALPFEGSINCRDFPSVFTNKNWFGNLEGAIVNKADNAKPIVFNNSRAIKKLISDFNFVGFALANNHIFDTGSLKDTTCFLDSHDIKYCGIGKSIYEASKELVIYENGVQIVVVNFGWEVIQCEITTGDSLGVNPLRKNHVLRSIKELSEKYPDGKIIAFMHWSYELEAEPQPFERELSRRIIDLGAAGVIGSHPHRIGGFELYNSKPIIYSLGNWLFRQKYFKNGKSVFPDFCNLELAFEWDFLKDQFSFHFFEYDKVSSFLSYLNTEHGDSPTMRKYTPFLNLSNDEYKKWYRQNHYHKMKGLPIYYYEDSSTLTYLKNITNKTRDLAVKFIRKYR